MDNAFSAPDGRTNPYCESESKDVRDPNFDLVGSNLARYRWYGPTLSRAGERDLIRRAQVGDEQARDLLLKYFSRTVLKIAGRYYGQSRDDLIAPGCLGLLEAIRRFDLSSPYGLRAYAAPWIRKFINEQIKNWNNYDAEMETRADRVLHSHASITAEELAQRAKVSLRNAQGAIAARDASRHQAHYSTTDTADDGDGTEGWDHGSDEPERHQNPEPAADHPMVAEWDCFNRYHGNHHLAHADAALAVRNDPAVWAQLRQLPPRGRGGYKWGGKYLPNPARGAYFVDAACRAEELYALRRIKQIGRQGYADELVADDNRRAERAKHVAPLVDRSTNTPVKPIPPAETLEKKAPIPGEFILLLAEKRSRDLKRVIPTPQVRQLTQSDDKCQTFANLLQTSRHERHCSPLQPELPKQPLRSSQIA
jgi:RNA polymerase sigma factor (sigma-70 family)